MCTAKTEQNKVQDIVFHELLEFSNWRHEKLKKQKQMSALKIPL